MGWRGAGGGGAATIGTYYFFGGMLQVIGSILEWIIGNTFIYIVFGSFGMSKAYPGQEIRQLTT
jgi:uncharacterized protein